MAYVNIKEEKKQHRPIQVGGCIVLVMPLYRFPSALFVLSSAV
jgi:hypothetical protein